MNIFSAPDLLCNVRMALKIIRARVFDPAACCKGMALEAAKLTGKGWHDPWLRQ